MDKAIYQGNPVYASDIWGINKTIDTKYEKLLKIASRDGKLICADCGVEVIYRHGQNRKEHFSHKNNSEKANSGCEYSRETEEHIEGKQLLRRHIKKHYPDAYEETRYRLLNGQWADIYFKFGNGQELIIEFQRNIDKIKSWEEKNNYYKANNINVMWFTNDETDLSNITRAKELLREYNFIFDKRLLLNENLDKNRLYAMDYVSKTIMIAAKVVIEHNNKPVMDTVITKTYKLDEIKILPSGDIECDFNSFFETEKKKFLELHSNITIPSIYNKDEIEFNFTDKDREFFEFIKKTCNKDLTKEQLRAVLFNDTHHAVMSTAGSGKTTVLCIKLAYLVLVKKISPKKIVVVSFSKNSAADIEDRFKLWFGNVIKDQISFSTIHSFAYKIIRDEEKKKRIKYTIIEDSKSFNKKSILSDLYKKYNKEKINEDQLKALEGFITFVRNKMIYMANMKRLEDKFPVSHFLKIYEDYSKILIEQRLLDYDTLLVMAHHILIKNPDILAKYQGIYSYYLVDESQDNSKIQNEILKLLVGKGTTCYVGDTDQRIYSWRGADERFDNFIGLYPNAKVLFMDENFRSTSSIVSLANNFIKCNKNRYDKNIYTKNEQGSKVKVISSQNEIEQLDIIVKSIKEQKRPYSDYAILYRNNISAIATVERLNKENIPFCIADEINSFFKNFIVNDIINFVRFALNSKDLNSFSQIYYKTMSYIPKKAISLIKKNLDGNVLDEVMFSDNIPNRVLTSCKILKKNFEKLLKESPSSLLDIIQYDMHYYEYLEKYSKQNNYSMESMDNILSALKGILASLSDIRDFEDKLHTLKELMKSSKNNKGCNVVSLSTMHSSKGLEWNKVFIIDTNMIPSKTSLIKRDMGINEEYEEELRTFFVAITRPKKDLTILQPKEKNSQIVDGSEFFKFCSNYVAGLGTLDFKYISIEEIKPGITLYHRTFGEIYINKIFANGIGEIAIVDGGEVKNLSFKKCIENHLLKKNF